MEIRRIIASLGVVVAALLGAGVFHFAWLAVFLFSSPIRDSASFPVSGTGWWVSAPLVTALGFAIGIRGAESMLGAPTAFWRVYPWPLAGCMVGAAAVFPFGPMLIVFGMFALGTLSVVVREILGRIVKS